MRKFRNIIESSSAPNIQDLWLYKGDLKYHNNDTWVSLLHNADRQELEEKVDSLDKEVGELSKKVNSLSSSISTQSYSKDIKTLTSLVDTLNTKVTKLENIHENK